MWTIGYKGRYITGYCHKEECSIVGQPGIFKSLLAAKQFITRYTI